MSDIAGATLSPYVKRWFLTGVAALALAGVWSLVLVVARSPGLSALPLGKELFAVALVVHVDLSVLVWCLALTAMCWQVAADTLKQPPISMFHAAGWWTFLAGTLLMAVSPAHPEWEVIKSNYIPVLHNPVFFLGLGLIASGLALTLIAHGGSLWHGVRRVWSTRSGGLALWFGLLAGSAWIMVLVAMLVFWLAAELSSGVVTGLSFYETAFWGGGHILQFVYAQILALAWVVMAVQIHGEAALPTRRIAVFIALLPVIAVLPSPLVYALYDVTSFELMKFFTWQMNTAGAIAPLLCLWGLRGVLFRFSREQALVNWCLWFSVVLFIMGGLFGSAISGENVRVPAHYHGMIVGITIALMGLGYALLPFMGARQPGGIRWARWQPICYGVGQLMHIGGLAWSGGYGVLRKTAGNFGDGAWQVKAAMGVMGLGGLLAIIGGLLYCIIIYRAFRKQPEAN